MSQFFRVEVIFSLSLLYHCHSQRMMHGVSYKEHKTNEHLWQQVNILAGREYYQPSSITSYHGSAMSPVVIRCPKSYYI